jgi:hypothetical protein
MLNIFSDRHHRNAAERRQVDATLPWNPYNAYDQPIPSTSLAHDNDSSIAGDSIADWQTARSRVGPNAIPSSSIPSRTNTPLGSKRHRSQVSESGNPEYAQRMQTLQDRREILQQQLQEKKVEKEIERLQREIEELDNNR